MAEMDEKTIYTLGVTVALALIGIAAKYWNDLTIARRKDRLERINQQLRSLYGPLYALNQASEVAWASFRSVCRPGISFFGTAPPPTPDDLAAWRLWMAQVFMPLNLRLEKAIVENADLLLEHQMPECLVLFCAHVAAYKAVLKRWEEKDFVQHTSLLNYPAIPLREYVQSSFVRLKREQAKLIGQLGRRAV